jgi:hypothetical protein
MRVLISGTGRGGTNLLTEFVKKISDINFTEEVEDREFFNRNLPENYGTKLTIDHKTFTYNSIRRKLNQYPDLKILFAVRHPIDNCLSKVVRGQPASHGGDKVTENVSDDGVPEAAVQAIKDLYLIMSQLTQAYQGRVEFVRLESLIQNPHAVAAFLSSFLGIAPKSFEGFQKNNRNRYQKGRYGDQLAPQINLFRDLDINFNGFFKNDAKIVEFFATELGNLLPIFYRPVLPHVYTRGTLGDAYMIVLKLCQVDVLNIHHFTVHTHIYPKIAEVFSLLGNVRVHPLAHPGNHEFIYGHLRDNERYTAYPDFDLPDASHLVPAEPYNVVQLRSGVNQAHRVLSNDDLERLDNPASIVLVGTDAEEFKPPKHWNIDKIVDLRNKTTIAECLSVIRGSSAFAAPQGLLSFAAASLKINPILIFLHYKSDVHAIKHRINKIPEWKNAITYIALDGVVCSLEVEANHVL